MTCGNDDCTYKITFSNFGFLKILVNDKECPSSQCRDTFYKRNTVNVTVFKTENLYVKIFDFEFVTQPNVVVLGCEMGLFNDKTCTTVSQNLMLPDEAEQCTDDVCICGNAASQNYCDDKTNKGYCTIGQISWWHDYNEISTTVTPGPPVIISTIIDNVTVTLQESLTNAGINDHKDIIVSAFLNCTEGVCQYKTTVTNYGPGYYDYTVGDNKCTSPTCSGSFLKGHRAPVILNRKNQNLEILAYQYTNGYPEVTVLGCGSGLILHDTCQRSLGNAYFDSQYYNDVVCSCQGAKMGCDDLTQIAVCIGGTLTWWTDTPGSTYPTSSSIATTTFPPQDPNVFHLTFFLSEFTYDGSPDYDKNVTLDVNMNCSAIECDYSVLIREYAQNYYTIYVNGEECPGSHCTSTFSKYHSIPVHLARVSEYLNLFDLEFQDTPNVKVLGCNYGMLEYGGCRSSQYYDDKIQKDDIFCVCQSSEMKCDQGVEPGFCSDGDPVWWKSGSISDISSSTSLATTSSGIWSTTFFIGFNETVPTGTQRVSIETTLECPDSSCTFKITVNEIDQDYFRVYQDHADCTTHSCAGTFFQTQSIHIYLRKADGSGVMDLFDLGFKEVVVLNCTDGWLDPGKCLLAKNGDDEMCSCQDTSYDCGSVQEYSSCLSGTPVWWTPNDQSSTSIGTTSLATSSPSPSTSTSSGIWSTKFFIGFFENTTTGIQRVSIETELECPDSSCNFKVTVNENAKNYFWIDQDTTECTDNPCTGTFSQTNSIHIYLYKAGGFMDLFDLRFKEVVVLNCTSGWLEPGKCLKAKHGDDEMCSCQDTSYDCGSVQEYSSCLSGPPEWWKPHYELSTDAWTTSPSSPSTSESTYTTTVIIKLSENQGPENQQISIQTTLRCQDDSCTYDIEVDNNAEDYFSVSLDDQNCYPSCHGSFYYTDTCRFYVYKGENQKMDLFDLKFKNVTILGCTNGWLEPGKCLKAKNGDDEMCSCQDADSACGIVSEYSECQSGTPLWWQPDHTTSTITTLSTTPSTPANQYVTVSASLSEDLTTDPYNFNIVTVIGVMNCTTSACQYGVTVDNQNPDYYLVLRNGEDCPTPCQGMIANGDLSVIITVHRQNQHLDFMEFQFQNAPKVLVMGCEAMGRDGGPDLISAEDNYQCLHIFETTSLGTNKYFDDVCLCKEGGDKCDNQTPVGKCTSGKVQWWHDDFSSTVPTTTVTTTPATTTVTSTPTTTTAPTTTVTTTPSTTTVPTTTVTTTTVATTTVPSDKFSFEISLTEGRNNRKNEMMVSSEMDCDSEKCDFWIKVDNRAQTWFKVYMGSEECQNQKCSGSIVPGASANVTIYRSAEFLDFFDFQYKKIVVLGCDNGLLDYGSCVRMTKAVSINGQEYIDEICSCRNHEMDCRNVKEGVCVNGVQTWWKDAPRTSTTSGTSSEATTVPTTTATTVPSLQDLANGGVDLSNVTQVLNDTEHYSKQGMALNHTQIFDITKILHNSANLPGISQENAIQILQNMDQCLNAHKEQVRRGQTREFRLLSVLRPMVMNTKDKIIQYLDGKNLGFNAKKVNCQSENHTDDGLIDYGRDIGFAVLNDTNRLSSTQHNSIIVPLGTVCQDSQEISHVFFTIFRGQKLFRGPQAYRSYGRKSEEGDDSNDEQSMNEFRQRWKRDAIQPNETEGVNQIPAPSRCVEQPSVPDVPVMSATLMIGGAQVHSFPKIVGVSRPPMAKLQFNTGKIPRPLHGQKIVTWFDESKQEWALEEKCKMESDENGIVSASCEHLTDFTVLIYGQLDAEQVCSWPLIIIGYSVNGASIFCLLLLIVIGLMFYIQTDTIRRILSYIRGQAQTSGDIINLSYYCIFLMFFVLSLFFMDQSSGGNEEDGTTRYCVVIAAMSYFSLISLIEAADRLPTACPRLPTTCRPLPDPLSTPCRPLSDLLSTASRPLVDCLSTSCRPLVNRLSTACRPLADRQPTTFRPLVDRLSTSSRPLVDRLSTACRRMPKLFEACRSLTTIADTWQRLSTACQPLVDRLPTACRTIVDRLLTACLRPADRLSTACRRMPKLSEACRSLATIADTWQRFAIMMSMLIGIRMICHFFSPKLRAFFKVMTSPPAALSIGVIIPFTLTLILALFEREFFERNDAFCWVRPDYIAYAVIVPVILPIINGVLCSTFAIYKMFFQAKRGLRDKETSHYDAEFWSKVLGLIIMQFAMGLPWGIEFILIGVAGSSAWNYVFVILLGTQGIDLFLIFLYRRQRLVNESRKWSAREEKMERKRRQLERSGEEG
ncbi:hypothetical protein B9Z55_004333 [Caenorhabditis nigoni]|nr:hypothetical protein B9Z55_004333 [Caenorhabditis nigoni]